MADNSDATGSPQPDSKPLHEKNQSTPSGKKPRNRKHNQTQSTGSQLDGNGSDSVTNVIAAPRSKKQPKHKQNGSSGATHISNGSVGRHDMQSQRPASVGTGHSPATPLKEQAYAGPTFQASPAPSSLPVPRFFSKSASVPNAAVPSNGHQRFQSQSAVSEQSSPESDAVIPVPARGATHSPLDLFFNADRAERERSKSSGHMLSPEFRTVRPRPPMTEPRNPFQQSDRTMFLQELDGSAHDSPSPSTTPFHRQRPGMMERAQSSPDVNEHVDAEKERNEAYTKSLKELLFNNINTTPPPQQPRTQSNLSPFYGSPSPSQRVVSSPSTPVPHPAAEHNGNYTPLYGNRKNLSPLFKAARDDTPSRPSSLRQELHNDQRFGDGHGTNLQPHPSQHNRISDPNTFSRQYLNQHIAAGQQAQKPHFPFTNQSSIGNPDAGSLSDSGVMHSSGVQTQRFYQSPPPPSFLHQSVPQHPHAHPAGAGVTNPPPPSGTRDLSAMSDDLRRMLNL